MAARAAYAALVLVLLPVLARAQETLTLDRAIQDALANNRGLIAARAASDEAAARVNEARSGYFPRLSFVESWQRGDQPVFVFSSLLSARRFASQNFAIDALNSPDPIGFFHGMFSVEQVLFDGGRTRGAVRAAASGRDMASAAVDETEAVLMVRVTESYGRVLRTESAQRAAESAVRSAQEDIARAERRRDAGMATDADVLSLAVHLADMRQRTIQAAGDAAIARAELNKLLGAPVARMVVVEEPASAESAFAGGDLDPLFEEAESARPELRRAAAAVDLAEAQRRQSHAAWWPQLVAQGAYQVDGTRFTDRASAWVVGGELRWAWSTGGAQSAALRASQHAVARARTEHEDMRAAIQLDVLSAVRAQEAAMASEAVARSAVEQARESERIIRNRFDAGLAGVSDLLRASTATLDAEARRVAAVVNRVGAGAAFRRALGRDSINAR